MTHHTLSPVPPGSVIGIIGGGQLGRMLALSAARLGLKCRIFDPSPNGPAALVSDHYTHADYSDLSAVKTFAKLCDIVTYEFENVPLDTALAASTISTLYPRANALNVAQDRYTEKSFIRDVANVAVANFEDVTSLQSLQNSVKKIGMPCILKTRRMGYDGKGQFVIRNEGDINKAWKALDGHPAILEQFIPFSREVSVIAARNTRGEFASYPLIENVHKNQVLHTSTAPAAPQNLHAEAEQKNDAQNLARNIMDALGYVGVMATEFFEMADGSLIVNEIAPRVHNSGHWTQDAGCIDQFELHIRAICGWPLGTTTPLHTVEMTNLLGKDVEDWAKLAHEPQTFLHLYGKSEPRKGRKMGHINRIIMPKESISTTT